MACVRERIVGPSLTLPKGREFVLAVFEEVEVTLLFLEKGWYGAIVLAFFLPLGRALKKSPFFMTKTENAYDL